MITNVWVDNLMTHGHISIFPESGAKETVQSLLNHITCKEQ